MPSLQKQLVPIPLSGGLDGKTDPFQVAPGKLLDLQNAEFTKQGRLSKRRGYSQLSTDIEGGGAISAATAISSFQDELLLFTGTRVYSFLEATGAWIDRGAVASVMVDEETIRRTNDTQQLNPDVGYLGGIEVYAWEDESGAIQYSVRDSETGAFAVSAGTVKSAAIKPRVVAFGTLIYIFYTDGINNLLYRTVSPSAPATLGAETTVAGDMASYGGFDVVATATILFLAYLSNTPGINVTSFDLSMHRLGLETAATGATASDGSHSVIDTYADQEAHLWVSWSTGTDVQEAVYDTHITTDHLSLINQFQVAAGVSCVALAGVESATAGVLLLFTEIHASDPSNEFTAFATVTTGGVVVGQGIVRSVGLASKPILYNGARYANLTHQSTLQNTYFTVFVDDAALPIVAKSQPSTGGGLRTNGCVSNVPMVSATEFLYANGVRGKTLSEGNTVFSLPGVASAKLDFASPNRFLSATQSRNNFLVGGVLNSYDGVSFTEHLFHLYPEGISAVAAGADGFLSTGTYQYVVTYEWTDNEGQIQRSAPSVAKTVSVTALNHVTLTVPTLRLTAKRGNRHAPSIVIYRTTANGTVFFRVTDVLAPLLNQTDVDTLNFVDVLSDADILSTETVYTTGGVLPNIAPPAHSLISLYQGRVVLGGLSDKNLLWFSKNKFDNSNFNTIPVEFSDSLTVGVDSRGGGITALGLLDDKLIIFKTSSIFYLTGDGPNDTGGGTPFGDPVLLTTDVGCINPNSVVITPVGIMFQSDKGKYLLDRSAQASYIGAPVEDFNSLTVTSATLCQDTNQVIFTHSDGPALVYDYYFQQWSTWTNHIAEDSDLFQGQFAMVRPTGQVLVRDTTRFDDAGKAVYMSFTTPWFQFAGLNGFQRVFKAFVLGQYKSNHTLNVEVGYDFNPAFVDSAAVDASRNVTTWGSDPTWGAPGTVWGGAYSPYEYRFDMKRQKCTSMRMRVGDTQAPPYGEGWSASALTLEVGVLPGGNRVAQTSISGTK